jgi:hypothetical protein
MITADRWLSGRVLLAAVLAMAGCGSRGGTLSGTITVDGTPLANGMLMAQAADGSQLSAPVVGGRYELRQVPLGSARLAVRGLPPPPMIGPPPASGTGGKPATAGFPFVPLPDDYADPDRSGLRIDVTGGSQRADLEISSAGPASP